MAQRAEASLVGEIRRIHARSGGVFGAPRVTAEPHWRGRTVNHKRVLPVAYPRRHQTDALIVVDWMLRTCQRTADPVAQSAPPRYKQGSPTRAYLDARTIAVATWRDPA